MNEANAAQAAPELTLRGHVDSATTLRISGWAFQPDKPDGPPVTLVLSHEGAIFARCEANKHRGDLERAGLGHGRWGFELSAKACRIPPAGSVIEIQRESDMRSLPGSPSVVRVVRGSVGRLTRNEVVGWAVDDLDWSRPIEVQLEVDGEIIERILANAHRADLEALGVGDGRRGFRFLLPTLALDRPHQIRVVRASDGALLDNGAQTLPATTELDASTKKVLATLLESVAPGTAEADALAFLFEQLEKLRARRAERDAGSQDRVRFRDAVRRLGHTAAEQAWLPKGPPAPRALIIDDQPPKNDRDAGSVAILSHIRALGAIGYEVSLVGSQRSATRAEAESAMAVEALELWTAPEYPTVEDLLKRQRDSFDLVYIHRFENAWRYLPLVRAYQPKSHIIYGVADLHFLRHGRQGRMQNRPELVNFSQVLAAREMMMARNADAVVTHSEFESRMLKQHVPPEKVHVVPWSVTLRPVETAFENRRGLAFIGSFGHAPNPDALYWLARTILPLVWARLPDLPCQVVGSGWSKDEMPQLDPRIQVIGPVDDLSTIFNRVRLTVAPLRFGAGIKGKVLESFAAGVPCAVSPMAAEGILLSSTLQRLVGTTPADLARIIVGCHEDSTWNREASHAALALVRDLYNQETVKSALERAAPLPH